uniref:Uncharacterized protein n=1 Tax=Anopheles dirus TaxID=7168 RepID=A0A182NW31_9DIPT
MGWRSVLQGASKSASPVHRDARTVPYVGQGDVICRVRACVRVCVAR